MYHHTRSWVPWPPFLNLGKPLKLVQNDSSPSVGKVVLTVVSNTETQHRQRWAMHYHYIFNRLRPNVLISFVWLSSPRGSVYSGVHRAMNHNVHETRWIQGAHMVWWRLVELNPNFRGICPNQKTNRTICASHCSLIRGNHQSLECASRFDPIKGAWRNRETEVKESLFSSWLNARNQNQPGYFLELGLTHACIRFTIRSTERLKVCRTNWWSDQTGSIISWSALDLHQHQHRWR